ncbi:hypothetical protein AGABI1DRAFT_75808 [Agaricus bisporus var. burnettii JB137-S8]|uniref:Uncharacterized protein n=1 Tax=Agaricus bisporus var. burnettii (strain JB137-S8 / ATCC MYA-4627 / FGSC 10392) TaxID=597362 RepID=K5X5R9_AGABU|nr:uncharacterized protein AGABI1DRAFT_75808 [Agaricus bisporus var. burnettii JB137-S8]EKM78292.1 hypothetical protein AGABI1DRAFT_75808 [Agaricus bisporus var. burnettii JB137-S8]
MATSPARRPAFSTSQANLHTPSPGARHHRLNSPSQTSLNIPEGGQQQQFARPPSPLRNGFVPDSGTGIDAHAHSVDDDDDARWEEQSLSPSSSVSQLAANLAQRVGSLVEGIKSRPQLPTDEELEAEAQRERDRSRREAEAIIIKEAQQRRLVEDRVLSMMQSTRSLPEPPSRAENISEPPSPAGSHKDLRWWTAAKKRLTPTKDKDPMTPAQQVIHDAKTREKELKKSSKGKEKANDRQSPNRLSDTIFNSLNIPAVSPQRKPVPGSPVSPTPSRPSLSNMAPNLTPSPMRSGENLSTSPSRDVPPLYAQFNGQGTLDVPSTLLVIAKRFEKLEKWTVGHVRALEERMNDVERWLVDKEKEREGKDDVTPGRTSSGPQAQQELNEIREEIGELQGRVGMLGREMARMSTAPSNLSSGPPSRHSPLINNASPTNSMIVGHHSPSNSTSNTPHHSRLVSVTARESTSPPMASSSNKLSGTKLPYPTGDYASLNDSFSPPNSPPATKTRHMSISGPLNPGPTSTSTPTTSVYPNTLSASTPSTIRAVSPVLSLTNNKQTSSPSASITSLSKSSGTSPNLPAPQAQKRQASVSPTPRKRYTVALGEPIRSQSPVDEEATPLSSNKRNNNGTPISFHKPQTSIGTAMFSNSQATAGESGNEDDEGFQDETIGKSSARLVGATLGGGSSNESGDVFATNRAGGYKSNETTSQPSARPPRRPRPQSTYAYGTTSHTLEPPQASIQPLNLRVRSKSTDRFGSMESLSSVSSLSSIGSGRFVDPLLVRRQEQEQVKKERGRSRSTVQNPRGKVPIGQLVAFFDGDKKDSKT